jgi:hypothetical protein
MRTTASPTATGSSTAMIATVAAKRARLNGGIWAIRADLPCERCATPTQLYHLKSPRQKLR